jgi:Outer membrane protein beta-barrel family/CarboxypepD_reg-like domain
MRTFVLTFLLTYILTCAYAQTINPGLIIKGVVVDSLSGKPLSYVTVAIQDPNTKIPAKNTLTKEDGSFEISLTDNKAYLLTLAFTGYLNKTVPIASKEKVMDLGTITLTIANKELKEVTVIGVRPVLKRDLDGITYDVSADPESPALTALDMMRKVPLLSVDASDNIKLKGNGNYKILINGKESALLAKNPSDVLRSMPATNIEKIEVITTPPAKYDAEGLAGIINIITKKKLDQGYNIGVNGRYNSVWGPGLNVNGTFKQGKFGLSGYVGYNVHREQTTGSGNDQTFFADNSTLSQNGTNTQGGHNNYGNLELSYEFDTLNLLTGSLEFYHGENTQNGDQLSSSYDSSHVLTEQYRLLNTGNNSYQGLDAALNYQLGFKKDKDRLLTLSYKYSYSPNNQYNNNSIVDTFNYQLPNYQQYNNAGNKEHTIQLDYVHPLKKITLEAGGKAIFRNNFSNFQTNIYNDTSKEYVLNPSQTDDFNYHQNIYSIYNSYQFKWDQWNAKAGLRLEHTSINADFVSVNSAVDQEYNNLIPSVSIQRNFKSSSINIGYTDRISRPSIYQLNPFVDQSNPKFVSSGNPNLNPELNHSIELNYSNFSKSSINVGLSYNFSNNSIQNVTSLQIDSSFNNTKDTVTYTTFQNLGSNSRLGLNFNMNFSIIKDLSVSLNGQIAHVWLKGSYNGQMYRNDGYSGNAFLNAGYRFGKGFRFGIDAGFFSGDVNLQGRSSGYVFTSYVFSKSFLNKKLTLSLVANNPYSKLFTFSSHTTTPDFYQYSFSQYPYRSFAIRVNFKFGKLNSDIKRNQRGIINDDTKGGKSSTGNQ